MKIENTTNVQMLYKGVADNSANYTKTKEAERQKAALETNQTVTSFIDTKGNNFDTKI
jgi:hypothetical protein